MLVPEAGNQRFVVCARQFGFQDIVDILRADANFAEQLDQRMPFGKPGTSSLPENAYTIDNSKVKEVLGAEFRDMKETVFDFAAQFLEIERNEGKSAGL